MAVYCQLCQLEITDPDNVRHADGFAHTACVPVSGLNLVDPSDLDRPIEVLPALDFIAAVRSNRPIRRRAWLRHEPKDVDGTHLELLKRNLWIYARVQMIGTQPGESVWINISNGQAVAIGRTDYLETDWEIMP